MMKIDEMKNETAGIPAAFNEYCVSGPDQPVQNGKEQKEKNLHQEKSLYHTLAQLPHLQPLDSTSAPPAPTSAISVSSVSHSPIPPLRQDPNLLRQFLPALQAVLQLHNSNVDTSIINEVLRAAVTRASLPSIIHNFLTVGPSAFNITSLISQAAQLSTQGINVFLDTSRVVSLRQAGGINNRFLLIFEEKVTMIILF